MVEDEPAVREFAAEVLREYGYNVLLAENAIEALPVIESGQRIDLLFTDVVLTGPLNGRQLADEFSARRPQVPVLFTTGYTRNAIVHNGRLTKVSPSWQTLQRGRPRPPGAQDAGRDVR